MNKRRAILLILFVVIVALFVYIRFVYVEYTSIDFQGSDKTLNNPARGFYRQFDTGDTDEFEKLADENISVVLLAYDLKKYVSEDISNEKLQELDHALAHARECGLSVVFRAAYGFSSEDAYQDAGDVSVIKGHIEQIAPILQRHKTILLAVQAGFIGPWGEWHDSKLEDTNGNLSPEIMNEVVKALCEAVPTPVTIALRRPSFIRALDTSLVTISRIGLHNDALLSTDSDMNTYDDPNYSREEELAAIKSWKTPVANGGEMPKISEYTEPENALLEFQKMKLTYLNKKYNREVLDKWRTTPYQDRSFFQIVENKLGYRLSLKSAKVPVSFWPNAGPEVTLAIENTGFSGLTVPYITELVIRDGEQEVVCPITKDYTCYRPGETVELKVSLPKTLKGKEVLLGIRICAEDEALRNNKQLAIEFANVELPFENGSHYFASYTMTENKYQITPYPF